jgi:PHB/PHA accumulation regulator DNA-binding domain
MSPAAVAVRRIITSVRNEVGGGGNSVIAFVRQARGTALNAYLCCDMLLLSPSAMPSRSRCEPMAKSDQPTIIEKYANRRLYNTCTRTLVTLEDLAAMVQRGKDFLVYDAKTGADITRSVQAQIMFEQQGSQFGWRRRMSLF